MRVVFMGTPSFAAEHLKALVSGHYDVVGVFSQKDRPRGRGRVVEPTPVTKIAKLLGLPVFRPPSINNDEGITLLESLEPDVIITVAFGKLLKARALKLPPLGCYNVHASLLPKFRGAAPIQRALMNGEKKTGITIFEMDKGMDSGPVAILRELSIGEFETFGSLSHRLCNLGVEVLLEFMESLESGRVDLRPQDESQATLAPKIAEDDLRITHFAEARTVCNTIRAFDPAPGAYTHLGQKRLKLFGAMTSNNRTNAYPGTIAVITKEGMLVSCEEGALTIERVQLPGKRIMSPWEARSGRLIEDGSRLGG